MRELAMLAMAGAAGAASRFLLSGWTHRLLGERFPFGTLAVNVAGCFLVGLLMEASLATDMIPRATRLALAVGFLGAFTTFSTFGYETMRSIEEGAWGLAAANVLANLLFGLAATWLGLWVARQLWGGA